MTLLQSILLGIIQGLTEFLPVSSSAHLVLVPYWLGWQIPADIAFLFDVLVQVATLIGVVSFFWKDLIAILKAVWQGLVNRKPFADPQARLGWLLLIATVPAGFFGMLIKDIIEAAFSSAVMTAIFLFGTALLLVIAERVGKRSRDLAQLTTWDAIWIGLFQAIAVFPGISRSGASITGGMTHDLDRPSAARFSFLMSIPIMLAAGVLAAGDLAGSPQLSEMLPVFIPGFIAAGVVGYLSIRWLLQYLVRHTFYVFAWYCLAIGALTLIVFWVR